MTGRPEFSRPVRIDTLGAGPRSIAIAAEADERRALARRFGLVDIESLAAEAALRRAGDAVVAEGRLSAAVTQSCVATGAPLAARLDEPFRIEFRRQPQIATPGEEIELGAAEMDVVFYESDSIDLGEAVAETLTLSLDPWPRAPDAQAALRQAGVKSDEEVGPFAALAGLKNKLKP